MLSAISKKVVKHGLGASNRRYKTSNLMSRSLDAMAFAQNTHQIVHIRTLDMATVDSLYLSFAFVTLT